jgi:hypothetical protein
MLARLSITNQDAGLVKAGGVLVGITCPRETIQLQKTASPRRGLAIVAISPTMDRRLDASASIGKMEDV